MFASSSLIYLNQSVPAYGIAVNSSIRGATDFPLRDQESKKLTLDCSYSDFVTASTMFLCVNTGEIYTLTLLVDNTNVVKGIQLDKNAECDLPAAVCLCSDGYLFVGSHLGDSMLFKYSEADSYAVSVASEQRAKEKTQDTIEG